MEFYLNYHGTLSTTGHAKQKFIYRRVFLKQLKMLDEHYKEYGVSKRLGFTSEKVRQVGPFEFFPLVTRDGNQEVMLDITILSQTGPGGGKQSSGDLDNLLKSLIDGLRMAQNSNEIRSELPEEGEKPFFCLLEDDQVIRNIQVSHNKLFFPSKNLNKAKGQEIFALIKVTIVPKFPDW